MLVTLENYSPHHCSTLLLRETVKMLVYLTDKSKLSGIFMENTVKDTFPSPALPKLVLSCLSGCS